MSHLGILGAVLWIVTIVATIVTSIAGTIIATTAAAIVYPIALVLFGVAVVVVSSAAGIVSLPDRRLAVSVVVKPQGSADFSASVWKELRSHAANPPWTTFSQLLSPGSWFDGLMSWVVAAIV